MVAPLSHKFTGTQITEETVVGPSSYRRAENYQQRPEMTYMTTYEPLDTQQAAIADQQAQLIAQIREESHSELPTNFVDEQRNVDITQEMVSSSSNVNLM